MGEGFLARYLVSVSETEVTVWVPRYGSLTDFVFIGGLWLLIDRTRPLFIDDISQPDLFLFRMQLILGLYGLISIGMVYREQYQPNPVTYESVDEAVDALDDTDRSDLNAFAGFIGAPLVILYFWPRFTTALREAVAVGSPSIQFGEFMFIYGAIVVGMIIGFSRATDTLVVHFIRERLTRSLRRFRSP